MRDLSDRAIRRWDVAEWLRQKGVQRRFTETRQVVIKCPHCHDYKFRLYISLATKLALCFNCSWKGNAVGLVQLVADVDYLDAHTIILGSRGVLEERELPPLPLPKPAKLPEHFRPLELPTSKQSKPYWDYLVEERHLAPSLILKYRMGYCRVGRYHHRVVIPVYMEGDLRSWVARSIGNAPKKYLTLPDSHMADCLFNYDEMIGQEEAVLVEGVFDALRMPTRALATFGDKLSRTQRDLLRAAGFERLVLCYDGDAWQETVRYAHPIRENVEVCVARLPSGFDPGNAPALVLEKALREARPLGPLDDVPEVRLG